MIDIFNKAKEFIGLGPETMDGEPITTVRTESASSGDFVMSRPKTSRKSNPGDVDIALYEPRAYEYSTEISARLRQGNPVIINLKYLDQTEGTRLIDFVCGTAFAIDGHMVKIADTIFLLTPSNVTIADLSSDQVQDASGHEGLLHNRL